MRCTLLYVHLRVARATSAFAATSDSKERRSLAAHVVRDAGDAPNDKPGHCWLQETKIVRRAVLGHTSRTSLRHEQIMRITDCTSKVGMSHCMEYGINVLCAHELFFFVSSLTSCVKSFAFFPFSWSTFSRS